MIVDDLKKNKTLEGIALVQNIKEFSPRRYEYQTNTGEIAFSSSYTQRVGLMSGKLGPAIGIAFDILAKVIVAKHVGVKDLRLLVNVYNKEELENDLKRYAKSSFSKSKQAIAIYLQSIANINKYLNDKEEYFEHIVEDIFWFGRLRYKLYELIYELTEAECVLQPIDIIAIKECINLGKLFYEVFIEGKIIKPNSKVIISPGFGYLTKQTIGAESDIYIDGVLYDFKAGKNKTFSARESEQIFFYFLLDCLRRIEGDDEEGTLGENIVTKIGFYRARYGIIETFNVKEFSSDEMIISLKSLRDYALKIYEPNAPDTKKRLEDLKKALYKAQQKEMCLCEGSEKQLAKQMTDRCEKRLRMFEKRVRAKERMTDEVISSWVEKNFILKGDSII